MSKISTYRWFSCYIKCSFYDSRPPNLSKINCYIINSDFDIINLGDYRGQLHQHIVRGRPQVTIALKWKPSSRHARIHRKIVLELVINFAPRKIYLGVSENRRVKHTAKILSDFELLWKEAIQKVQLYGALNDRCGYARPIYEI
jgi:hypothetical protein